MSHYIKFVCFASLLLAFNASAEDMGVYLGGSLGYTVTDLNEDDVSKVIVGDTSAASVIDEDDDDIGWKLFGGFNINRYLNLEVAYVDLGEAEATAPSVTTYNATAKADGFTIAGVARYPVNEKINVYGKLGAFIWDADQDTSVPNVSLEGDDGTDFMFGIGAQYQFQDNAGIRAEWERFTMDTETYSTVHTDMFSAGLFYNFSF